MDQMLFREKLGNKIQNLILESGSIEGTDDIVLTNTLVIETLLEIVAAYAAMHGFKGYTTEDLVSKYCVDLNRKIDAYRSNFSKGMQFKIVPLNKVH